MISRFVLVFLAGVLAGFLAHLAISGDFGKAGTTSVASVPQAKIEGPPASVPRPRNDPSADDGEAGLLLRKLLAESPVQLDTLQRERDEAYAELLRLSKEFLLSYGTMDQAGATVGGLLKRIMDFENLDEADVNDDEQRALVKDMVSLVAMSDAVRELDANPEEASTYHSAVLEQVASLSPESTNRVRSILEQAYRDASVQGINYASRPDEGFDEWTRQRTPYYERIFTQIESVLSPDETAAFSEFIISNGFMTWKLVDPFDPAVFVQPEDYTGQTAAEQSLGVGQ